MFISFPTIYQHGGWRRGPIVSVDIQRIQTVKSWELNGNWSVVRIDAQHGDSMASSFTEEFYIPIAVQLITKAINSGKGLPEIHDWRHGTKYVDAYKDAPGLDLEVPK